MNLNTVCVETSERRMEPHSEQHPGVRASRDDSIDLARLLQVVARGDPRSSVRPSLRSSLGSSSSRWSAGDMLTSPRSCWSTRRIISRGPTRRRWISPRPRPRGRPERGRDDRYGRSGAQDDRETRPDGKERIQSRDFAPVFDSAVFAHGRTTQGERGRGPGRRKPSVAPDRFPYCQITGAADRILQRGIPRSQLAAPTRSPISS